MRKLLKTAGILFALALTGGAGLLGYVTQYLPNIPVPQDLRVAVTPERVKRGEYLALHVTACMDCHSTRDWSVFSAPLKPGTLGVGGERFDQTMHFPGAFIAPNLTPHALKDWTDGELYRAITSGVSRDGHPLFPVMPYLAYGKMATEDIHCIIAYLRSLPSAVSNPGPSKADPPVNVIMHLMPQPANPAAAVPAKTDSVAYGGYLASAAGCTECHTKSVQGKPVGQPFAGGFEFPLPGGTLRSANITPHATKGIGAWTKEMFVARFKAFAEGNFKPTTVDMPGGQMQTVMPWTMYAGMTEEDLGAIFDYLKTLPAADSAVERWSPAGVAALNK
jgi:mono/diheme cytochrome c family protein